VSDDFQSFCGAAVMDPIFCGVSQRVVFTEGVSVHPSAFEIIQVSTALEPISLLVDERSIPLKRKEEP
jgi:hypothetical protein